jgi:Cyclic nucleotide-binding domain
MSVMRIESSVTSITWIPSDAIEGMTKLPFEVGVAHYDDPPPDTLEDIDVLRERDAFREANVLRAYVEVEDGKIAGAGHLGRGLIGVTRLKLGSKEFSFPAVKYPVLQNEPELGDGWVRFTQTAGGRMGLPAPRRVRGKPFFQVASASAWTTLQLVIYTDGTAKAALVGASPFPRHWIYDHAGKLVEKSGSIDFDAWYREVYGAKTPWGENDWQTLVTPAESELERELSASVMKSGAKLERRQLGEGQTLVREGEHGRELYLILDGVLSVEQGGEPVAEVGPGAILGEKALLGDGTRTATLVATTNARVAVIPPDAIDEEKLKQVAADRS